jgi:hypothetical protein
MPSRVDRVNRTVFIVLGVLLLGIAAVGLLISFGVFSRGSGGQPVVNSPLSDFVADNPWFWWIPAVLALVVVVLALLWLRAQLSTSRLRSLDVEPDSRGGETVLRAGAIAEGVEDEVERFLGVRRATMRLLGTASNHRHQLTVVLEDRADIDAVRNRLTTATVPNIRRALDFEDPEVDIRLVLTQSQRRRVG